MNLRTKDTDRFNLLIYLVSFALVALIAMQCVFMYQSFRNEKLHLKDELQNETQKLCRTIEDELYCFEGASRAYFAIGDHFSMLKERHDSSGSEVGRDTVPVFFPNYGDTGILKRNKMRVRWPMTAEIKFKLKFMPDSTNQDIEKIYREIPNGGIGSFSKKLAGLLKTEYVIDKDQKYFDSVITKLMSGFDINDYSYQLWDSVKNKALFSKGVAAGVPDIEEGLAGDAFFNPGFRLKIWIGEGSSALFRRMMSELIVSVSIMVLLLVVFVLFLRKLLNHRKVSRLKMDFLNNMAHEFRTPISNINLAADTIAEHEAISSERDKKLLHIIRLENQKLQENVNKMLLMAHENRIFNPTRVNVHEIILRTRDCFAQVIDDRNGRFDVQLDAEDHIVFADEIHLSNVIYNLVDNAVKYSHATPEVKIVTYNDNGRLLIRVKDNGIGIGREFQELIFDRFYRVPTGNVHDVKGFGLGLSYVKDTLRELGGSITLESAPGQGSEFTVELKTAGNR